MSRAAKLTALVRPSCSQTRLQSDAPSWHLTTHAEDSASGDRELRSREKWEARTLALQDQGRDVASYHARSSGRTAAHARTSRQRGRRPTCARDHAWSGCHRRAAIRSASATHACRDGGAWPAMAARCRCARAARDASPRRRCSAGARPYGEVAAPPVRVAVERTRLACPAARSGLAD